MIQRSLRSNTTITEFPQEPPLKKPRKRKRSESEKMEDDFSKLSEVERSTKLYKLMMGVKKSQDETTFKLDNIQKQISGLESNHSALCSRVNVIESSMGHTQSKVQQNEELTNYIHQQTLENDIIVMGLPQLKNEELPTIIKNLNKELELTLDIKRDFKKLFIQNDLSKKKSILKGKLYNLATKDIIIEKFKGKKPITVEKIATLAEDNPLRGKEISITGNLTPQNRFMLKETQKFKHIFQFIWADTNGRILVRRNDKTPAIHIKNCDHLNKITNDILAQSFTANTNQRSQPYKFNSNSTNPRNFRLTQPTLVIPNTNQNHNQNNQFTQQTLVVPSNNQNHNQINQPPIYQMDQMDWNVLNQPNTTN